MAFSSEEASTLLQISADRAVGVDNGRGIGAAVKVGVRENRIRQNNVKLPRVLIETRITNNKILSKVWKNRRTRSFNGANIDIHTKGR